MLIFCIKTDTYYFLTLFINLKIRSICVRTQIHLDIGKSKSKEGILRVSKVE